MGNAILLIFAAAECAFDLDMGSAGPVFEYRESMPVTDAILMMIGSDITCIPVLNNEFRPVGIVTSHDLLRWCSRCGTAAAA